MKKAILFLVFSLLLTLLVVSGGTYALVRYAPTWEKKLGLAQADSDQVLGTETLLNAPPLRGAPSDLEIFRPLEKEVFRQNPIQLEGKTVGKQVLVTLNKAEDELLSTDKEGRFKGALHLREGANQITLLTTDSEGKEVVEELVVGLYPAGKEQEKEYLALLGEIKTIQEASLELITHKDTVSVTVDDGTVTPVSFGQLEATERIGVIAVRAEEGGFTAKEITVDLYPYNFYGTVVEKSDDLLVVERKRPGGSQSRVFVNELSRVARWSRDNALEAIAWAAIDIGDRVYVNGFIRPKEARADFFAHRILVLEGFNN